MPAVAAAFERAQHTGAAEQLGLKSAASSARGNDFTDQCSHSHIAKARGQRVTAEWQKEMIHAADARGRIPQSDSHTRAENRGHTAWLSRNHHVAGVQVRLSQRAGRRKRRDPAARTFERECRRLASCTHAVAPTMPSEAAYKRVNSSALAALAASTSNKSISIASRRSLCGSRRKTASTPT